MVSDTADGMASVWQYLLSTLRNNLLDGVHLQLGVMASSGARRRDEVHCAAVVMDVGWCPRASIDHCINV
jgi:hypothetical protein